MIPPDQTRISQKPVPKQKSAMPLGVICVCILLLFFGFLRVRPSSPVVIHWNSTRQTVDGFGASATGYTGTFTAAQADAFFNPAKGLGLSLLRLDLIPGNLQDDCNCVANNGPAACVIKGDKSQIVSGDLQVAQMAAARGVRLLASPWSPPAKMKSSGKYCSSGSMIGTPANYAEYAGDLASFPALLKDKGLALEALSIQNEPDVADPDYNTCTWQSGQIHDFIPQLSKALQDGGYGNVKIAVPEESMWTFELMDDVNRDPAVASDVGLVLGHAYFLKQPPQLPATNGRHVWQTEVGGPGHYDGSMKDALHWAQSIHEYMIAGANAWMFWNLDCGAHYFNHDNNMCLTDTQNRFAKRAYVLGQYAKFIRLGWQRIDVSNTGRLLVTAYKGPDNQFAVVIVNRSWWPIWRQSFTLDGISAGSSVTPWHTSMTNSLEAKPPVTLSMNGTVIHYTVPARSVVTFVGKGD